ncbi:MAG: hypothetical protein RL160_1660 [Bacteroidota bacterium]|jgi:hypothetical protein
MKLPLLLLPFLFPFCSHAQQQISVQPHWNGAVLDSGNWFPAAVPGDSIRIDVLRFYLGIQPSGAAEITEQHLVDFTRSDRMSFFTPHDRFRVLLGVDSLIQVSGAAGGDLDPTLGMYWTWQSGYIHLKLEGLLRTADGAEMPFNYHIGGFEGKHNTLQSISIDSSGILKPNLAYLFSVLNPHEQPVVMSPGAKALLISQYWKDCFTTKP